MVKKIFLIFFGIFIFLVIAEITLRLSGIIYYKFWMKREAGRIAQEQETPTYIDNPGVLPLDTKVINILCVGDSWTFGIGTVPGYSYPAQLQIILDKNSSRKFKVYNAGIPGCSAGELLKYLPVFLKRYKPGIVIMLIGTNDIHNNHHPDDLIQLRGSSQKFIYLLRNIFLDMRIYKVVMAGLDGIRQKTKNLTKHNPVKEGGARQESLACSAIGEQLSTSGNINEAKAYLEKAMHIDPSNEYAYLHLGHLYHSIGQYAEALMWYERLIEVNPHTSLRNDVYQFLFLMFQQQRGAPDVQERIRLLMKKIPSDNTFKNPGQPFIPDQRIVKENLEHNLEAIYPLVKSHDAMLIIQTYFSSPKRNTEDGILEGFAKKHNIYFIDNEKLIDNLADSGTYFVADGHPNGKGYNLVAENIYRVFKENNLIY